MRRFLLSLALLVLCAPPGQAQNYPDHAEIYVNDFADLLNDAQEDEVRDKLKELRRNRGIEFTVVTIASMSDFGHSGPIEPFATGLFNYWGVGNAERNDGVMMLIARYDRHMRIEVGAGYGTTKNDPMKRIIDDVILPEFRNDNYALGIDKGVDAVILDLTGFWPGEYGASAAERIFNAVTRFIQSLGLWVLAILAPFLAIPVRLYRRWRRNRPRICPNDSSEMVRLPEDWDDNHLQKGQITEEQLSSVDYDVWECPQCEHRTIQAYPAWFSSYGACRSCKYRTVEGETEILKSATTSSTGLKRIDYYCHHCHDSYSVERVIPKKSKSSSSSSFGGGSSSGGGASGSW